MAIQWKPFGKKHLEFIATPYHKHKRITILSGAVRSAKTISMMVKFLNVIQNAPSGTILLAGVSKESVYQNVLKDLFETIGEKAYKYNAGTGALRIGNRDIRVVGAKDEGTEKQIRGATFAAAYIDEATICNKTFILQVFNRCSIEGAKIFMTTNPDSPYNWLYKDYIINEERMDMVDLWTFTLHDNAALSDEYKEFISKAYTGVFYRRNILGEWCNSEGRVYSQFDDTIHIVDELPDYFEEYVVGADWGTRNPTFFVLMGKSNDTWYIIKEYCHSGRETEVQLTPDQYAKKFLEWIEDIYVSKIYMDPSAVSLITAFNNIGYYNVDKANNAVIEGIQRVSELLNNEKLLVHRSCERLIEEFNMYSWDEKASQSSGKDVPLKVFDHGLDAVRYVVNSHLNGPQFFTFNRTDWGL